MAQTLSDSCVPQQNQRVLLGILIDVSHSMQTSWRNQDGKPLPRIEVIRDAVNKKILEERKRNKERPEEIDNIDMFCLGFGFRYPLYIQRDITICEEDQPFQTQPQTEVIDLVCDLLALTDILPTKEELSDFKQRLNEKWHQ